MLFNSLAYAAFLPLVCLCCYALPPRFRWAVLLVFSYWFYMSWNARLALLILFTTAVSYAAARLLERTKDPRRRKWVLGVGAGLCLCCLFVFKYLTFFWQSLTGLGAALGLAVPPPAFTLLLPVGISFYTFQTLSYVIDIYRGRMAAERHFGYYALYVSFFPQLVAGPIERAENLLPQLRAPHPFDRAQFSAGLGRIAAGMFKKVVIADFVATYVNNVYNDLYGGSKVGLTLVAATVLFGVQIYCDFAGYSEIAVGSAQLLGIRLMENFDSPYMAASLREFWRRWHISLNTWFTDYVYIPLGGNCCSRTKHWRNLLVTFLLSGLWHGADWTFALWGLYHGLLLCLETLLLPPLERLQARLGAGPAGRALGATRTLGTYAAVTFGWIFFRANSAADLGYILRHLWHGLNPVHLPIYLAEAGLTGPAVLWAALLLTALAAADWYAVHRRPLRQALRAARPWQRWLVYYAVCFAVLASVCARPIGAAADFIYFQF